MESRVHVLTREECYDRLRVGSIGRIAITHQALPSIVPVNYVLLGPSIVFRTDPDGMLAKACQNTVVAFEVDDLASDGRSGWSVVVVGVAELLSESAALRAIGSGLVSAAGEGRDLFVAISMAQVTGRLVEPLFAATGARSRRLAVRLARTAFAPLQH